MIKLLSTVFIASGLAIIGALLYLRKLTRRGLQLISKIVEVNESLKYDAGAFLNLIPELLKGSGIKDIAYSISYEGTTLERPKKLDGKWLGKTFKGENFSISFSILPERSGGELSYLYKVLLEVILIVIHLDIALRIVTISETFVRMGRIKSFILHDIKNLSQFIKTLSYNVHSAKTDEEKRRLVEYLKESLPHISLRSERILSDIEKHKEGKEDLAKMIKEICSFLNLDAEIRAECSPKVPEMLRIAFENIMKNISEKRMREENIECSISIEESERHVKITIEDTGSPIKDPERVFEPFYTTKRGGLGIGLFQAKIIIDSIGGDIKAENTKRGVRFTVTIPKQV